MSCCIVLFFNAEMERERVDYITCRQSRRTRTITRGKDDDDSEDVNNNDE